jgi:hypothetical protein
MQKSSYFPQFYMSLKALSVSLAANGIFTLLFNLITKSYCEPLGWGCLATPYAFMVDFISIFLVVSSYGFYALQVAFLLSKG